MQISPNKMFFKKGKKDLLCYLYQRSTICFSHCFKKKKKEEKKVVKTCSLGTSFPPRNKGDLCVGLEARQGV